MKRNNAKLRSIAALKAKIQGKTMLEISREMRDQVNNPEVYENGTEINQ